MIRIEETQNYQNERILRMIRMIKIKVEMMRTISSGVIQIL